MDTLSDEFKVQGHHTQPHLKGLTNVFMFIQFEEDTTYSCIDIEANV